MIGVVTAPRTALLGALALLLVAGAAVAGESTELVDIDSVFAPGETCHDDSPGCLQRRIFGYFTVVLFALGGSIVVGGVVGASIALVGLRRTRHDGRVPRKKAAARVIGGPVHEDGTWVRMVEVGGHPRMEVLGPDGWRAIGRDPAPMVMAMRPAHGRG